MSDKSWSLGELARHVNGKIEGDDGNLLIFGMNTLDRAGPNEISFLANPKYIQAVKSTKAAAVIIGDQPIEAPCPKLIVKNSYLALARIMQLYFPPMLPSRLISTNAVIHPTVEIGKEVAIGDHVSIGKGSRIGDFSSIYPGVIIGENVSVGSHCIVYPNVVIYMSVKIGSRVIIHANAVLGSDGFGYAKDGSMYIKVPQIGGLTIEDDVEIGACTTIDRGSLGQTIVSKGCKLDNLIQIAHNVQIGEDTAIAAQTGISGSTIIGNRVVIAGQVGMVGHIKVGDDSIVTSKAGITSSLPPKSMVSGFPYDDHRRWLRIQGILNHADDLKKRVKLLEKRLESVEQKLCEKEGENNRD